MKKTTSLLMILFMVLCLAGCGQKAAGITANDAAAAETAKTEVTAAAATTAAVTEAATAATAAITVATTAATEAAVDASTGATPPASAQLQALADPYYELDKTQYEAMEFESQLPGTTVLGAVQDKNGIVDVIVSVRPGEGRELTAVLEERASVHSGCWEVKDVEGEEIGIHTFYDANDGDPLIYERYTMAEGKNFMTKTYIFHTKEVPLGNTGYYMTLPKAMHETEPSEGAVAAFVPEGKGLCDITVFVHDMEKATYEDGVMAWEGYQMPEKEQFDKWKEDGFDIAELDEYFSYCFQDCLVEQLVREQDGQTYNLYETWYMDGDTRMTLVTICWLDGQILYEAELTGPSDTWPNIGKAILFGIHKK